MKGIIFTTLNDMLQERHGVSFWEQVLHDVGPASGGIYTSVEDYPDAELFQLVTRAAELLGTGTNALVQDFGHYLFATLARRYPVFVRDQPEFFGFIKSIDGVIHKEVKKLYHNPNLPSMQCEQIDESHLRLFYRSPRRLCRLACGLIQGAAGHYGERVELEHGTCMHLGADHCVIDIRCK